MKSSSIVAKRERAEALSPELKSKIERYVVYWRRKSGGKWPVHAAVAEGTPAASFFERTKDRIRHRVLRTKDQIVPYAYAVVPVSIWQKYRQVKSRVQGVATGPSKGEAAS